MPEYNLVLMTSTFPAMLIRLPNHVGDVVLALPAIERIERAGFQPHLLGKPWIQDLLSPYQSRSWVTYSYPRPFGERLQLLRKLRQQLRPSEPQGLLSNALVLPNSFSSAFELRLAGWRPCGYAGDGRAWLLHRKAAAMAGTMEYQRFFAIAQAALGQREPAPPCLPPSYFVSDLALKAAQEALTNAVPANVPADRVVLLCPFAAGQIQGRSKEWPHFPALAKQLCAEGFAVVVCPGSASEKERAKSLYPQCIVLANIGLADYGALLSLAGSVVANDTGPGHLAAAVGANLISVRGPDSSDKYLPTGARVRIARSGTSWPELSLVRGML